MKITVTYSNGVTVIRDVERIEMFLPASETQRRVEVYTQETILVQNTQIGDVRWLNNPLILDWKRPRMSQIYDLLKAEIEELEKSRVLSDHGNATTSPTPTPTPTPNPSPSPSPGVVIPPITTPPVTITLPNNK